MRYTILRPQLIVGPNYGVVMNLPPVIGAYAAICKEEGRPFGFPGGASFVWEAVDTRLVAERDPLGRHGSRKADGQHFNLTNGEVFEWRDLWPALAEELGVEVGPDEPVSIAEYLPAKADVWDRIVDKHGLRKVSDAGAARRVAPLRRLLLRLRRHREAAGRVRQHREDQAGRLLRGEDTEESFRYWIRVLQERKVLPRRRGVMSWR